MIGVVRFTKAGKEKTEAYIAELKAKRKEILDAGKDTADETSLPTISDILFDIEFMGLEEDGKTYWNTFGVTDHYDADSALFLEKYVDFIM